MIKLASFTLPQIVIGVLLLGALVAAGVVAALLLLDDDAHTPDQTARLLPSDTDVYLSVNLRPGRGQLRELRDIVERFQEHPDIQRRIDELLDDAEAETSIDPRDDLVPWLGPEVAIALIDAVGSLSAGATGGVPLLVVLMGTTDEEGSRAFLESWIDDYQEKRLGFDFRANGYRGLTVHSDESGFQHYAMAKEFLVFSTDQDLLEDTIDRILDGNTRGSLYESARFQAARGALSSPRFSTVYVDTEAIGLDVRREYGGQLSADLRRQISDGIPEWIASAGSFVSKGVKMEVLSPESEQVTEVLEPENSLSAAGLLPADTMAFVSFAVNPDLDPVRDSLKDQRIGDLGSDFYDGLESDLGLGLAPDDTLDKVLDAYLDLFEEAIGLDLEQDFLSWMTGGFSFAWLPTSLSGVRDDPESQAVEIGAFIQFKADQRTKVESVMGEVVKMLEEALGANADSISFGDGAGAVFDLAELDELVAYQPGYLVLDDHLVLSTTQAALEGMAAWADGAGASLAQEPEYSRILRDFEATPNPLVYVNLRRIIEEVVSTLDQDERQYYQDEVDPFAGPLKTLVMAGDSRNGVSRFSVVLTVE